jgi:hypothetical protein
LSVSNYDNFSGSGDDTVLSSHTSTTGSTYVKNSAVGSSNLEISFGAGGSSPTGIRVSAGSSAGAYFSSAIPYSADYDVSAQIQEFTNTTGDQAAVLGRYSTTADSGYGVLAINGTGYLLYKKVAGAFTQLGTTYGTTTNNSDVIKLRMRGSTISMLVNGVVQASVTDTTYSATGIAGVYLYTPNASPNDQTNLQIKWFCVEDQQRSNQYVCCHGDSRTWSYYCTYGAGTAAGTSTPGQLLSLLGSSWTADNFGVPGCTIAQLNALASTLVDPTYSASRANDVLIMEGGFNDMFAPYAASQTTAQALATVQTNYIAYWSARRAATPGRTLIGCGIGPCGPSASVVPNPTYWNTVISAFNSWLLGGNLWMQYTNGLYLPNADARIATGTNSTYDYNDEVHYVDAGYGVIAQDLFTLPQLGGVLLSASSSGGSSVQSMRMSM